MIKMALPKKAESFKPSALPYLTPVAKLQHRQSELRFPLGLSLSAIAVPYTAQLPTPSRTLPVVRESRQEQVLSQLQGAASPFPVCHRQYVERPVPWHLRC
mmetsp:Transcript_28192/g.73908  ORF Transcript_28192/g.73908 Transcript_28192/m.73908 type:complete len:101 (-) Transcript_28192:2513-2815(-)